MTRNFLKELGISDKDIADYIAGPGFIAWFAQCFSCGKSTRTLGQLLEAIGRMDLMVTPTADITAPLQFVLDVEPEEIDDALTITELPDFYKRIFSLGNRCKKSQYSHLGHQPRYGHTSEQTTQIYLTMLKIR